ncbi:MAG: hypothetical protein SFX18_07140 [Pirellulales bacterium]|nr:hypothetical protein [Pirellulales bacterium]
MTAKNQNVGLLLAFAFTTFVSAFLLFLVQPLISKVILPWFGGSTGVWATCLVFFQVMLCFGYAYAHYLQQWCAPRKQALIHLGLLLFGVCMLPIRPSEAWEPPDGNAPIERILWLLLRHVGVPYFALSATGPLLQSWYARCFPGHRTYRLYSLSNIGSLASLLMFPFVMERYLDLGVLTTSWAWGFVAFAVGCAFVTVSAWQAAEKRASADLAQLPLAELSTPEPLSTDTAPPSDPTPRQVCLWVALPGLATFLLISLTNHLCQDVASIPLLWILPLSLYLLSFIICFDADRWYQRVPFALLAFFSLVICTSMLANDLDTNEMVGSGFLTRGTLPLTQNLLIKAGYLEQRDEKTNDWKPLKDSPKQTFKEFIGQYPPSAININYQGQVFFHLAGIFGMFMLCHGELARLKPSPRHLTGYFMLIAIGGALGGVMVSLVAPVIFTQSVEWQLGIFISLLLSAALILDYQETYAAYFWRLCGMILPICLLAMVVVYQNSLLPMDEKTEAAYLAAYPQQARHVLTDQTGLFWLTILTFYAAACVALLFARGDAWRPARFAAVAVAGLIFVSLGFSDSLTYIKFFDILNEFALQKYEKEHPHVVNPPALPAVADQIPRADGTPSTDQVPDVTDEQKRESNKRIPWTGRNFYGTLKIEESIHPNWPYWNNRELLHGRITHGIQYYNGLNAKEATTYYTPNSGAGLSIIYYDRKKSQEVTQYNETPVGERGAPPPPLRVGAVGLGTGTLAAYALQDNPSPQPASGPDAANDKTSPPATPLEVLKKHFTFYEINQLVVDLSEIPIALLNPGDETSAFRDDPYFTFVKNARRTGANIEMVMGDARLSLKREAKEGKLRQFDVLLVDAFSGDSIPTHLLTSEALAIYLQHLHPDGALAIHISNRYLDLEPVCKALAEEAGMSAVKVDVTSSGGFQIASNWVVLSKNNDLIDTLLQAGSHVSPLDKEKIPVRWTDDFTSVLDVLTK